MAMIFIIIGFYIVDSFEANGGLRVLKGWGIYIMCGRETGFVTMLAL